VSTVTSLTTANVQATIKVVDSQGNPVSGANVTIPSAGLQGVTDAQGIATFTLPLGSYSVTISKGAYSQTQTINVTGTGQTFTVDKFGAPGGIPGFPFESIIAGLAGALLALGLIRRRRKFSSVNR
jgi:hypothetical protein